MRASWGTTLQRRHRDLHRDATDRHPTDIAGLRGARLVTSVETEAGQPLGREPLKTLTGGDRSRPGSCARTFSSTRRSSSCSSPATTSPACAPSTKRSPAVSPRSLHRHDPGRKRDKQLPDRLLAERDGILAWALQGCLAWQRIGLRPPAAVMAATDDYFAAEDAIGRWLDERCVRGADLTEASTPLFADWKLWAEANGEYVGSNKRFAETLTSRGFERSRTNQAKGFRGLCLRSKARTSTSTRF